MQLWSDRALTALHRGHSTGGHSCTVRENRGRGEEGVGGEAREGWEEGRGERRGKKGRQERDMRRVEGRGGGRRGGKRGTRGE